MNGSVLLVEKIRTIHPLPWVGLPVEKIRTIHPQPVGLPVERIRTNPLTAVGGIRAQGFELIGFVMQSIS